MFTFFYTRNGKIRNESGQVVDASVDTGVSVTLVPSLEEQAYGIKGGASATQKKLNKTMIERFRHYNGGELPRFRLMSKEA